MSEKQQIRVSFQILKRMVQILQDPLFANPETLNNILITQESGSGIGDTTEMIIENVNLNNNTVKITYPISSVDEW